METQNYKQDDKDLGMGVEPKSIDGVRDAVKFTYSQNIKYLQDRIETIEDSMSYRLGFYMTAPFRYIYCLATGKKFQLRPKTELFRDSVEQDLSALVDKLVVDKKSHSRFEDSESDFEKDSILLVFPELPQYDKSSGGRRANRILEILCKHFNVYVFSEGLLIEKYVHHLSEMGCIILPQLRDQKTIMRLINIRAIVFSFYYCFINYRDILKYFPEVKVIVDSVDVHWVREERGLGIYTGLNKRQVQINKNKELEAYRMADSVWAVTPEDRKAILEELPEKEVAVVSNVHDVHNEEYTFPQEKNLLFLGGFRHYPNISAVQYIVQEILPLVREDHPDSKLILAGSHAPEEIKELALGEGIEYLGFVEEEDLEKLYAGTAISLCPLLIGAGIKGKVCESIAYGVPVATNGIGNEGINLRNIEEGLIADDPKELASLVSRALNGEFDLGEMVHKAQDRLLSLTSPATVEQAILDSVIPHVVISIVTWNRLDFVQKCIESIEGNTNYPHYTIAVHSNGCTDGTQDYLRAASDLNPRIEPILSEDNDVFVKPNNAIMRKYSDSDVVLLNNDTQVTENWLRNLHRAAYSSDDIGISGSKVLYPDGKLQEFGSELYGDGTGKNIGKWDDPAKEEYRQMRRVGYVSGCSMYIKRDTIDKIGVFDERFHPCYCEDSDYCYTAWKNDLQTVVVPESIIFHYEGGTSGTDENKGFKKYQVENFEKFLEKHGDEVDSLNAAIEELNKTAEYIR